MTVLQQRRITKRIICIYTRLLSKDDAVPHKLERTLQPLFSVAKYLRISWVEKLLTKNNSVAVPSATFAFGLKSACIYFQSCLYQVCF